ncbi:MAG: SCP2 sterol-binding domain-containing protein [Actinomycetota bacterium]
MRFLSEEWTKELKTALNANEAFTKGVGSATAKLQQVVTGPDGEHRYWIKIEGGAVDIGSGDIDAPDATITQDYETAVALSRSELNPVSAFMSGRLKIGGNMMLLMQLQGAFSQLPQVMQEMDVEY